MSQDGLRQKYETSSFERLGRETQKEQFRLILNGTTVEDTDLINCRLSENVSIARPSRDERGEGLGRFGGTSVSLRPIYDRSEQKSLV